MHKVVGSRRRFRLLGFLALAILLVGCGAGSDDEILEPTQPPATSISTPDEPVESEDDGDEGGGNVITRSLRTGGGWVWSGLTWVWDRGSDGANAVWDAINGASSFLWNAVRGLPSDAWHQIQRFWNWVWGTNLGEVAVAALSQIPELLAKLNPIGFFQGLINIVVRILQIGLFIALIGVLAVIAYKFRLLGLARSLLTRREPARRPRHHRAQTDGSLEQRVIVEVQPPTARPASSRPAPATSVPQVPAAPFSTIPGSGVSAMWSRNQIRELRTLVTNPTIVAMFEIARQRDGGPVNYRELIRATGLNASEIGGHFSAFFRKARAVHSDDEWPIEIVIPTDEDSKRAYFVPQPYLDWWFEE